MFFAKLLSESLNQEWQKFLNGSDFEIEWDKYKKNPDENQLYKQIVKLIFIIENKSMSDELRKNIVEKLNDESQLYSTTDLTNLINYLIKKFDYQIQFNSQMSEKNKITYQLGERNITPTAGDGFIACFSPTIRNTLTRYPGVLKATLLGTLSSGFYLINNFAFRSEFAGKSAFTLTIQLCLMACISGAGYLTEPNRVKAFEHREKYQVATNELKYLKLKLDQVNLDIKNLESILTITDASKNN